MADLKVRTIDESELDTILAADVEFDGDVQFDRPLLVKGTVKGTIQTESDLFVAEGARVEANVTARRVSVKGLVVGDVRASNRIELFSDSTLEGNIRTPDLIVQSGSKFTGKCDMRDDTDSPDYVDTSEPDQDGPTETGNAEDTN